MAFDDATFVHDVFSHACRVLRCGGGVVTAPETGIPPLRAKYGQDGLLGRCLDFFAGDSGRDLPALPEGAGFAMRDILYYLADAAALARLLAVHRRASPGFTRTDPHNELSLLIAAIAQRLGLPLPDDIPPATDGDVQAWMFPSGRLDTPA